MPYSLKKKYTIYLLVEQVLHYQDHSCVWNDYETLFK